MGATPKGRAVVGRARARDKSAADDTTTSDTTCGVCLAHCLQPQATVSWLLDDRLANESPISHTHLPEVGSRSTSNKRDVDVRPRDFAGARKAEHCLGNVAFARPSERKPDLSASGYPPRLRAKEQSRRPRLSRPPCSSMRIHWEFCRRCIAF